MTLFRPVYKFLGSLTRSSRPYGQKEPRMRKNLTGLKYGRLAAIKPAPDRDGMAYWTCRCACGRTIEIAARNWGRTLSCGCAKKRGPSPLAPQYSPAPILAEVTGIQNLTVKLGVIADALAMQPLEVLQRLLESARTA